MTRRWRMRDEDVRSILAWNALRALSTDVPVPWNPPKVAYLSPEDAEAVSDVVSYYFNAAGTPMVDAWTTAGRWVSLPQAFVEVGY